MALATNPIWQLRYNLGADGNYNPFIPSTTPDTPAAPATPGITPIQATANETGRDNRGDARGNNSSLQQNDIGIERREYEDFFSWAPGKIIDQNKRPHKLAEGWGGGGTEESSGDSGVSLLEAIGIGLGAVLPIPGGSGAGYYLGGKVDDYNSLSDTIDIWGRPMDKEKSWWDKLTASPSFAEQEMSILNAGPTPAELDRMNRPGSGKDKGAFVPDTPGPRALGPPRGSLPTPQTASDRVRSFNAPKPKAQASYKRPGTAVYSNAKKSSGGFGRSDFDSAGRGGFAH